MATVRISDSLVKVTPIRSLDEAAYKARIDGRLADTGRSFRVIDLYAGAGGLTLGFTAAFGHCFLPVWANDIDPRAAATYEANFGPHCVPGDILDTLRDPAVEVPKADVVIGGPPCQGFSLLNRNRDGDPRKELWWPFMEVVQRSQASVFVMENVPQLLNTWEHHQIKETAERMGFRVREAKLCAAQYDHLTESVTREHKHERTKPKEYSPHDDGEGCDYRNRERGDAGGSSLP